MELKAGTQIDRYALAERIGEGGQGEVWRADDRLQPGRAVALKLVPLAVAESTQIERVRREARYLARLNHPSLPACHGLFEDLLHGLLVVVMELVQGPTLAEATTSLDEPQRLAVLRHLASALSFLHGAGVVHRDVKPENLILSPGFWEDPLRQGSVKLIDLGISVSSGNPQPLTVVGHIIGTPSFLAPEILDPHYFPEQSDTPATDIFAFGVLGWLLLHGVHPTGLVEGSSMTSYALAYRQADQEARWPAPARHDRWEQLLRRCLAVRARERLPSGAELLAALSSGDAGLTPSIGSTRVEPIAPVAGPLLSTPTAPPARLSAGPTPSLTTTPADGVSFTPPPSRADRPSFAPGSSALPATRLEPAPSLVPPQASPLERAPYVPRAAGPHTVNAAPLPGSFRDEPSSGFRDEPSRSSALPPHVVPHRSSSLPAAPAPTVPATAPGGVPATAPGHVPATAPGHVPATAPGHAPVVAPGGVPATAPGTVLAAPAFASSFVPPRPLVNLPAPPAPAAPAPVVSPQRYTPRRPSGPLVPASKPSLGRYLLAFFLLLFGGAAAFVLTVVIFVLFHIGR